MSSQRQVGTAESFKYEVNIIADNGTMHNILPKDLENCHILIQPISVNSNHQYNDWNLSIDGVIYPFSNNFYSSGYSFKNQRFNMSEIHRWKDITINNPDYMLLTLSRSEPDDFFDGSDLAADPTALPDPSNLNPNPLNTFNSKTSKLDEYKLTFRPNLSLARKLYMENHNIPIRLIQVIYMFLRRDNAQILLRDSESELMSKNPPGFRIKLYDYQAKTLTWMRQIESGSLKIKYYKDFYYGIPDPDTNEPFCYVSSKDVEETAKTLANYHIYQDPPDFYKEFKINGGLLGDIMGNGKTVTGIGHVYSEHCRLGPSFPPLDKGIEEDSYIPSRATLILCPNNIIDQWYNEFVKCLGTKVIGNNYARKNQIYASSSNANSTNYYVIRISSMHHLNGLSHADLINADAVIVTYSMMTNANHIGKGFTKENGFSEQLVEQRLAKSSIPELSSDDPETWSNQVYVDLEHVLPRKLLYFYKWNRVIHDEFHEVIATKTRTNSLLFIIKSLLKARYYWGFSGSSILDNENILANLPYLLHFEDDWSEVLPMTGVNKSLFFDKCVIKNTKRILPPLKYVKIPVKPSEEEKMLYKAMAVISDVEQQVRFSCYHNLNVGGLTYTSANVLGVSPNISGGSGTSGTYGTSGTSGTSGSSITGIPGASGSTSIIGSANNMSSISNKLLSADEIMVQQHEDRATRLQQCIEDVKVMKDILNDILSSLKSLQNLSTYPFTSSWSTIQDLYFLTDSNHKDHNAKVKAALELDPHLKRARDLVREYKKELKALDQAEHEVKALEESNRLYLNFLNNKTLTCCLCDFTSTECNKFMALDCKDYFCQDCTELMVNSNQKHCPKCRKNPFDTTKLANLGSASEIEAEVRSTMGLSKRLWGSKICDIVDKVAEVVKEDSKNKVILFAQWEDLLEQFEVALSEVKIESCTVKGATSMRTKAIRTFQERGNCKVILLSSVYGASGINLVEANYVFIVHPFLGNMSEEYEYQAICRAYRTGQKRTVTVMHFIREDTYEQVLYSKKNHKDEEGSLKELDGTSLEASNNIPLNGLSLNGFPPTATTSSPTTVTFTRPKVTLKPLTVKPLAIKPLVPVTATTVLSTVPLAVPIVAPSVPLVAPLVAPSALSTVNVAKPLIVKPLIKPTSVLKPKSLSEPVTEFQMNNKDNKDKVADEKPLTISKIPKLVPGLIKPRTILKVPLGSRKSSD